MNVELAKSKNLIIGDDKTRYNTLEKKYRLAVELLVNSLINSEDIDKMIEDSGYYFSPSKQAKGKYKNELLGSNYLFIDNHYYVEKLNNEDIEIVLREPSNSTQVVDIIKRTIKEVVANGEGKNQAYGHPYPNRVIDNSTLIVVFSYGLNKENSEDYRSLLQKQKSVIDDIEERIKEKIQENFKIDTTIILEKLI